MKKILFAICLIAFAASDLCAQHIISHRLPIENIKLSPRDGKMHLDMDLAAASLRASKDREYVITPTLVSANGSDSVAFEPVIIAGRNLYYRHLRNDDLDGMTMERSGIKSLSYSQTVERQDWMEDATLKVNTVCRGCCDHIVGEYSDPVARIRRVEYTPVFGFVTPVAEGPKTYALEGSAFINFPVNRTELYPDYMDNPAELRRIISTIDSVKNDPDVTITSIFIKGFASPEGPYDNNVRLARGRTQTLKEYVEFLYHFAPGFISTDYLPENWPGLRDYMTKSSMANRDAILAIIDSNMDPDAKDARIKKSYPTEYEFILRNVYPRLRRSDYVIKYTVKSYTTLEEILAVLHSAPHKLSQAEFYRAAQSMEAGSQEYNEVFETAVRMYPFDPVANINAANSAMSRGDFASARRYLDRAGDAPVAIYARGVFAALQKDYPLAEDYFKKAKQGGYPEAAAALSEMEAMKRFADGKIEILTD